MSRVWIVWQSRFVNCPFLGEDLRGDRTHKIVGLGQQDALVFQSVRHGVLLVTQ